MTPRQPREAPDFGARNWASRNQNHYAFLDSLVLSRFKARTVWIAGLASAAVVLAAILWAFLA